MAKINVDWDAFEISKALGLRDRPGAKRLAIQALSAGRAGPETQKLAAYLLGGRGGRPPVGRYRLYDIGFRAEELEADGVSGAALVGKLMAEFGQGKSHIDKCLAEFRKARQSTR